MDSDNYKQKQPLVEPYTNLLENKSNEIQKSCISMQKKWIYYIEERRKEVAKYGDWSRGVHLTVKEKIAALRLLKEYRQSLLY